jgi:hypothetical protein
MSLRQYFPDRERETTPSVHDILHSTYHLPVPTREEENEWERETMQSLAQTFGYGGTGYFSTVG